jgi:UDP-2,4-diacetamido-2,4,6-trideoxy-beta-L-altropyranose hydrolase
MNATAPNVAFRCEAAPAIGGGHAMRCLALADALAARGWAPCFVTRDESAGTIPGVARYPRVDPSAQDGLSRAAPAGLDLAIVDGYGFDRRVETPLRRSARRLAVIDDLADRPHDCDVLIDQTPGRTADDYRDLVPADCRLLLGGAYAILRPEFARLRPAALARRARDPVRRILLSFGASDPKGLGPSVAEALLASPDGPAIDLVPDTAGLDAARALAAVHPDRVALHYRTDDMAGLMARADLAAGAAGTTSWERCALGLPAVAIVTADNQRLIAARLAAAGAVDLVPEDAPPAALADRLRRLAADAPRRAAMAEAAAALVDARGVERIFLRLAAPQATPDGRMVALRAMETADLEPVFAWQTQEGQRRHFRDPQPPSWSGHCAWFASRVADPDWTLAIVEAGGAPTGLLQLRRLPEGASEVSILIDAAAQGRGLGTAALRAARAAMPRAVLEAEIAAANAASLASFKKAGYRPMGARHASLPARWPQ